jgi:hypothetical protein
MMFFPAKYGIGVISTRLLKSPNPSSPQELAPHENISFEEESAIPKFPPIWQLTKETS